MTPDELRRIRRRMKLTQAEFADLIGIAPNSIARMERGEMGMRRTTVRLIELLTQRVGAKPTRQAPKRKG